jgi:amphi-Trp domain-containing protein
MAKKTVLMSSKERVSRTDAAAFLRQLADKLEAGSVSLIQGDHEVLLDIPAQVKLEVDAKDKPKRRGTQRQLEIEIEWTVGVDGEPKSGLALG